MTAIYFLLTGLLFAGLSACIPMEQFHLVSIGLWISAGLLLTGLVLCVIESRRMANACGDTTDLCDPDFTLLQHLPKE